MFKTDEKARSLTTRLRHHPLTSLREEFDEMMENMFGAPSNWAFGHASPSLDLSETDNTIEAKLDLPGVDPEHIQIRVHGNLLTIKGEKQEEEEEEGKTFYRLERKSGAFSRSITLPTNVNEDEVAADFKNGVLTITLPKAESAKARTVRVSH